MSFPATVERIDFAARATALLDDLGRTIGRDLEAARAAAEQLVGLLSRDPSAQAPPCRGGLAPWQARRIDAYLADHLDQPVSVKALACAATLSVSHFGRAFKESYGQTPHAHVMRLRVERAQHLMLTSRQPLSEIALACGLSDQAHLSKLFRRRLGQSPNRWRRQHASGEPIRRAA